MTAKTPTKATVATDAATRRSPSRERALLVHVRQPGHPDLDDLEELRLLAISAGAEVVDAIVAARAKPDPATYIGSGKVEELRARVSDERIALVIVNHTLSPAQERNLEKGLGCRVLDRTGLILDIFAQRARSHEGKLQVELAQLEHMATRLVRGWTHLERQKGGIGLRGPGETQLETDRRLIGERIKNLNRRLDKVRTQRLQRRKARRKIPIPTVSLVGYTNAGKSSLFNCLTGAEVYAANRLFATLDPTMRRLALPEHVDVVLADTVGFIRHLPHRLVEAFHATLEEVAEADLLLHVVDAGHPERLDYIEQVNRVLTEIGADAIPQILVFNKIDLIGEEPRVSREDGHPKVWLSAHTGVGIDQLRQEIARHFARERHAQHVRLPLTAASLRARLYDRFDVLAEETLDDGWLLDLALDEADLAWLLHREDFRREWLLAEPTRVLARAGS